jgi:hypothetical protein
MFEAVIVAMQTAALIYCNIIFDFICTTGCVGATPVTQAHLGWPTVPSLATSFGN